MDSFASGRIQFTALLIDFYGIRKPWLIAVQLSLEIQWCQDCKVIG